MDSSIHNLHGVFRQLSRVSDGDHAIYLRTDSHNFFEIHRSGIRNLFTSTVAAFIPNVVIKLQTPLVSSIIAAVPSRQGAPTLHTRSGLFIVEGLSDIVNFVKHHRAAFVREDATLAVWADEVQPALAALHQVLKELGIALDRHDLVHVVDSSSNGLADSNADCDAFDEFIHNYDDPADKPHDELVLHQAGRNALLPLRSLDDAGTLEAMYMVSRANLFDSLSSDSLVLADSPFLSSAVSNDISRLCLNGAPQTCLSPTFSTLSFDFPSPSVSSGSSSDHSALSTPLTIAPSALSSPHSTWNSPQLPTISESSPEEALQDALPVDSANPTRATPSGSEEELSADAPSKRKRSPEVKHRPAGEAAPEKPRSRRASRVPTSPKAAAPPSPRARKTVSKAITPSPPASPRAVCPLPGRTGRTRSSSTSSTSSARSNSSLSRMSTMSVSKTRRSRAPAAQLTIPRVTHAACCESESEPEPEILESDDSGSEYEADPSELELDELDDEDDEDEDYGEYRPTKRIRSLPSSPRASSTGSSVTATPELRKAVSPKLASQKKKAPKKKKSSGWSAGGGNKKKKGAKAKAQLEGPPPMCVWCDKEFTRESDVLRHELHSCKLYPFERALWCCPLCDKVISRTDAVIRHQGSDDCKKRQRELRDQGVFVDKIAKKKAGARAAKATKAPLSPRRRPSRAVSL